LSLTTGLLTICQHTFHFELADINQPREAQWLKRKQLRLLAYLEKIMAKRPTLIKYGICVPQEKMRGLPFQRTDSTTQHSITLIVGLEQARFRDNLTFVGLDFRHMIMSRPRLSQEAYHCYMDLYQQGKLKAIQPISVYGFGEVEKAFRTMQNGSHIGKLVITFKGNERSLVRK
jgi:hypothetical protein